MNSTNGQWPSFLFCLLQRSTFDKLNMICQRYHPIKYEKDDCCDGCVSFAIET